MEIKKNLLVSSFNEALQQDTCQTPSYLSFIGNIYNFF